MKIQDSNDLIESELSEELHLPEQSHVMQEVASISVVAPRPRGNQGHFRIPMGKKVFNPVTNEWIEKQIGASSTPPETLPAFQALHWQVGAMGVDLRPHVYDGVLKKWCLLDTGSQCTAWPPALAAHPCPAHASRDELAPFAASSAARSSAAHSQSSRSHHCGIPPPKL